MQTAQGHGSRLHRKPGRVHWHCNFSKKPTLMLLLQFSEVKKAHFFLLTVAFPLLFLSWSFFLISDHVIVIIAF